MKTWLIHILFTNFRYLQWAKLHFNSYRILKGRFYFCQEIFCIFCYIYQIMGNQQDTGTKLNLDLTVQQWSLYQGKTQSQPLVQGIFYNDHSLSEIHYRRFYADQEKIYFKDGDQIRFMFLFLTTMEEKFYLNHGQRIYALKLTNDSNFTILSTYDRQCFISFYCALAKYCILNDFDRHFQVREVLGKGSYGTVYRGINRLSKEQVALKVFNKIELRQNIDSKMVVQNEIYVLQKLKKANLSPLYEIFQTSDCIILVLQIARQGDLLHFFLNQETIINDQLIKHAFQKILENLDALHEAGVIHRDIKPQNVVVRKNHGHISLFLCDFSISIVDNDQKCFQMRKMQAGSRGYIAPQVLYRNIYTQKCDVFSFGCLIFFLLSGRQLFEGISTQVILRLTIDNIYIAKQIKTLAAPETLKTLLRKILQVCPAKRISARQALNEQYFSDKEQQKPYLEQNDQTLKQFIEKRIQKYESSTRGSSL